MRFLDLVTIAERDIELVNPTPPHKVLALAPRADTP